MKQTQHTIATFVHAHDLETDVASRVLDLVSEIGEVSKELLKGTSYGKIAFQPTDNWESELGDALFSLICVANATGVDLGEALKGVLEKYQKRLAETDDAGSGD